MATVTITAVLVAASIVTTTVVSVVASTVLEVTSVVATTSVLVAASTMLTVAVARDRNRNQKELILAPVNL